MKLYTTPIVSDLAVYVALTYPDAIQSELLSKMSQ